MVKAIPVSLPFWVPIIPNEDKGKEKFPLGRVAEIMWNVKGTQRAVKISEFLPVSACVEVKSDVMQKQHCIKSALKVAALILLFPFFLGLKCIYRWRNNFRIDPIELAKISKQRAHKNKPTEEDPSADLNTAPQTNNETQNTADVQKTEELDRNLNKNVTQNAVGAEDIEEPGTQEEGSLEESEELDEEGSVEEGEEINEEEGIQNEGSEEKDADLKENKKKQVPEKQTQNPIQEKRASRNLHPSQKENTPTTEGKKETESSKVGGQKPKKKTEANKSQSSSKHASPHNITQAEKGQNEVKTENKKDVQKPAAAAQAQPLKIPVKSAYRRKGGTLTQAQVETVGEGEGGSVKLKKPPTKPSQAAHKVFGKKLDVKETPATKNTQRGSRNSNKPEQQETDKRSSVSEKPKQSSLKKEVEGKEVITDKSNSQEIPLVTGNVQEHVETKKEGSKEQVQPPIENITSIENIPIKKTEELAAKINGIMLEQTLHAETKKEEVKEQDKPSKEVNISQDRKEIVEKIENKASSITIKTQGDIAFEKLKTKCEQILDEAYGYYEDAHNIEKADKINQNYQKALKKYGRVVCMLMADKIQENEVNLILEDEFTQNALGKACECLIKAYPVYENDLKNLSGKQKYIYFRKKFAELKESYIESDIKVVEDKLKRFGKLTLSEPLVETGPRIPLKDSILDSNKLVQKVNNIVIKNDCSEEHSQFEHAVSTTIGMPEKSLTDIEMQDRYLISSFKIEQENQNPIDVNLFAIFDGMPKTGGANKIIAPQDGEKICAEVAKLKLTEAIKKELDQKETTNILDVWNALKHCLNRLEGRMGKTAGRTGVCFAIIFNDPITKKDVAWTANLGDSRAIFVNLDTVHQCSTDAVYPNETQAINRYDKNFLNSIEARDGSLQKNYKGIVELVDKDGSSSTLRYLNGQQSNRKGLSKRPEIMQIDISKFSKPKLLLVTKGTTTVIGSEETRTFVKGSPLEKTSNELILEAIARGSQENNTVMAINLLRKENKT